jgi:dephospho-CoA kinase
MFVVVLTGGLGAGKSTAAEYFRGLGASIIDTDDVAHSVLAKGTPILERVVEAFGDDVLLADGTLDRAALARSAFASAGQTRKLNSIVHPAVAREVGPALAQLRLLSDQPRVVVFEVPLLVEAPVFRELGDVVLAIVAPEDVRVARAVAAGMDEADARRRVRAQATDAQRAEMADVVIVNDQGIDELREALGSFWAEHVEARSGANS